MTTSINLWSILDNNKLTGSNFLDWLRNVRIVFKVEKLSHVLENSIPDKPMDNVSNSQKLAYQKHVADSKIASCIMWLPCLLSCKSNMRIWMHIPLSSIFENYLMSKPNPKGSRSPSFSFARGCRRVHLQCNMY